MIINSLIRALLENNSVIITGLGRFFVTHVPSQIVEEIVYPPRNTIEFEYSKDMVGFDFVSKLSEWNQIRIDEAQEEVTKWVNMIENGLDHNKTLFFDDFGTFSRESAEKMVFQSVVVPQLNIDNEGFEPVILPLKTNVNSNRNKEKPVKDKREILHKKRKKRDQWLFIITISIALILVAVLFLRDRFNHCFDHIFIKKQTELLVENIVDEDTVSCISLLAGEETELVFPIEQKESITSSEQELYLPYQYGKFYVIAGSFVKEESALLHIKQKKLDKFHAKLIVHPQNARIRVCIGVFDNEQEAINYATKLNENYWVLK